jgi:hypothetical protein
MWARNSRLCEQGFLLSMSDFINERKEQSCE